MNSREGIALLETILRLVDLNDVQEIVFRQSWEGKTYSEIAEYLDYDVDYIKNVGSQLWKLLSRQLGNKVSKSNFRLVLKRIAQQNQVESVFKNSELHKNGFKIEVLTGNGQKADNYLDQFQELTREGYIVYQLFDSLKTTQSTKYSLEESLNALLQLKAKIEILLVIVENAVNNVGRI
jgi:DNA-binding CsgD family transcriptional regulator